jgi:hypothetical protein
VHQISYIDGWRGKQDLQPTSAADPQAQGLVQLR